MMLSLTTDVLLFTVIPLPTPVLDATTWPPLRFNCAEVAPPAKPKVRDPAGLKLILAPALVIEAEGDKTTGFPVPST